MCSMFNLVNLRSENELTETEFSSSQEIVLRFRTLALNPAIISQESWFSFLLFTLHSSSEDFYWIKMCLIHNDDN
jgi:hypothetical protein